MTKGGDNPADFVELLKLGGQDFSGVSLENILRNVHAFVSTIWRGQRLYGFVDHGVNHGYRVCVIADDIFQKILPEGAQLSPIERLVLGIGCLVHDIGMQYNKYPKQGSQKAAQDIRSAHCDLGHEMISEALEGSFGKRQGPSLPEEDYHKMFVSYGALVGFSHADTKYWKRLEDPVYAERREAGLQVLRLRLLAAGLRLADELHTEYARIDELNWIDTPLLTPEEKAHWVACYYTRELRLSSPGTGGLRITMKWRVAENASEDEVALVRTLLQELRERKAAGELELIKEFLKWKDGMEEVLIEYRMELDPERAKVRELPKEAATFVRLHLRPFQFGLKKLPRLPAFAELAGGSDFDGVKNQAQKFFLSGDGTLRGHYRLKTGWHTNCYVRCRNLTADIGFATDLCRALKQTYKKEGFTDIISIGTSALRIGKMLSLMLSARHSYTFGDVQIKGELSGRGDYTDYEQEVMIRPNAKVLIIDDILAMGSVIEKVILRLSALTHPPKYVRALCIYALGDLEVASSKITRVNLDYLVAFPDVLYKQEEPATRTCEICQKTPHIAQDE